MRLQDAAPELLQFTESAAPDTPASGVVRIYAKTDGKIYRKDDAGTEAELGGGTGGSETTTTLGALINGASEKTTPVNADMVALMDSDASNVVKKLSWSNIKATLKTYFDSLYATLSHTQAASTITDFDTEVSNNTDVASNTSARHTHANAAALDAVSGTNTGDQDLSGYVETTGDETIAGVKTFSSFPVTPSSAPTTDYQAANKKYVDDKGRLERVNADIAVPDGGYLTNLVPGDFANDGSTGWGSLSTGTITIDGDNLVITGNGANASIYATYTMADIPANGDKFGFKFGVIVDAGCSEFSVKIADTDGTTMSDTHIFDTPTSLTEEAAIIPITGTPAKSCRIQIKAYYGTTSAQNGKTVRIKFLSVCNLTDQIGAGNEPSAELYAEWLDELTDGYLPTAPTEVFNVDAYKLMPRLLVFGDSIMGVNSPNTKGLPELLAEEYNFLTFNYSVGGATMLVEDDEDIPLQIDAAIDTNIDYILFNGLTNDISAAYGDAGLTGSISSGYSAALDNETFCGGFETALKTMLTKWLGAKIIFVAPHNMSTRDIDGQASFQWLARQMCEKWGVSYADVYRQGQMNTNLSGYTAAYGLNGTDGTHPSELGYTTFYVPPIKGILKRYSS